MKKLLFLFVGLMALQVAFGQTEKEKMQREREQLQADLRAMQANYNKVKGQQKATIGQLTILQGKMQLQGRYISNINSEIKLLSDDIFKSSQEITRLQRQLDTLKAEYARSVVYSYKKQRQLRLPEFYFFGCQLQRCRSPRVVFKIVPCL